MRFMDNKEIRRKILEYVYKIDEESPRHYVSRGELIKFLEIDEKRVDSNVLYLEEKGYLKLLKTLGSLFQSVQITSYGKDLVEDPEQFNLEFPLNITQNIVSNSVGTIIGSGNTQNLNITNSFNSLYDEIQRRNPEKKDEITKAVKTIEEELKKDKSDKTIIQKSINFLKQNAAWIVQGIIDLVKGSFGI